MRWLWHRLPSAERRRIVVLTGARQTGKTTLARARYQELRYVNLDAIETREALRDVRTAAWGRTVGSAILDEAQKEPSVFEKVKYAFDAEQVSYTVLLGSSRFLLLRQIQETLAGRAFVYELWPLMASELRTPAGGASEAPLLHDLVDREGDFEPALRAEPELDLSEENEHRREAWDHLVLWGGMPGLLPLDDEERRVWLRSYQQTFLERDLIDLVRLSDLHPFRALQRLCMLRTGQLLSYAELARDAQIAAATARRYLEYLRLSYQVVLLRPYLENLTSRVIKTPKLYWLDMGLLRQGTRQWGPATGALFETVVVGEIHKWLATMAADAEMFFYRTRSGSEVDVLLETPLGVVGVEIKSRPRVSAKDARGLTTVADALGPRWRGGLVVYSGERLYPLVEPLRIWAVPAHRLL